MFKELNGVGFKKMSREEEVELIKKYRNKKDYTARDKLVLNNIGLIKKIVKKFNYVGYDYDDLFMTAMEGALRAVERYDIDKHTKFSTYMKECVVGVLKNYTFFNRSLVKKDTRESRKVFFHQKSLPISFFKQPTEEFSKYIARDKYLDAPVCYNDGTKTSYIENSKLLSYEPDYSIMEDFMRIEKQFNKLTKLEKDILRNTVMADNSHRGDAPPNYNKKFGISKQRVNYIKHVAVNKIKKRLGLLKEGEVLY